MAPSDISRKRKCHGVSSTPVGKEEFEPQYTELSKFWTIPFTGQTTGRGLDFTINNILHSVYASLVVAVPKMSTPLLLMIFIVIAHSECFTIMMNL
jgi:hypothetical protein